MRKFYYCTTSWCGPCKLYGPVINRINKERDDVEFVKVDIEEQPEIAKTYEVFSVPTVIEVDDNGDAVRTLVGAFGYSSVIEELAL